MILVDDLLTFPISSVLWIFREIHHAAQEELANESEFITAELSQLYMMLETGRIAEEEFAVGENTLLERLDRIQERDGGVKEKGDGEQAQNQREMGRVA